jgi:hypothetical protein
VAAQIEQRASATCHMPIGKPLWTMLREPYMFEGPQHGFIVNDVAGLTMTFMARGVDWRAGLEARTYAPELAGRLSVQLADSVFGEQSFAFELSDGHARVGAAHGLSDVRCDGATFSQLFCGALSAAQARWYGHLEADDASVALLDQAFPSGPPFIQPADWF